ncbi:MAG: type IV pilin [Candidatus Heimdallarchaeota archaeon]|nr:type IV pilin [Candidatus Heimdallarchaeota archaeon]
MKLASKKAVSPVIAVVLLIALTVAASAIIYAVVNDIFDNTTTSFVVDTISLDAGAGTWSGKVTVSSEVSITKVQFNNGTSFDASIVSPDTVSGQAILTLQFSGAMSGSGDLYFHYHTNGGSNQIYILENVNFN